MNVHIHSLLHFHCSSMQCIIVKIPRDVNMRNTLTASSEWLIGIHCVSKCSTLPLRTCEISQQEGLCSPPHFAAEHKILASLCFHFLICRADKSSNVYCENCSSLLVLLWFKAVAFTRKRSENMLAIKPQKWLLKNG